MNLWSDEKKASAARLWDLGLSAGQIARELGVPRNAVIGITARNRAQFPYRQPEAARRAGEVAVPVAKREPKPKVKAERVAEISRPLVLARPLPDVLVAPDSAPITLMALTDRTCRWPVEGEGAATLFCGCEISLGAGYCDYHRARSSAKKQVGQAAPVEPQAAAARFRLPGFSLRRVA